MIAPTTQPAWDLSERSVSNGDAGYTDGEPP